MGREVAFSDYLHQGYQQSLDYEHQPAGEVEGLSHDRYKQDCFEYSFCEVYDLVLDQVKVLVLLDFVFFTPTNARPAIDKNKNKK